MRDRLVCSCLKLYISGLLADSSPFAGFGLRCQQYIWEICRCAGISDLAARVDVRKVYYAGFRGAERGSAATGEKLTGHL